MATNPFAGAGLSQFGQELSGLDSKEDSFVGNTIKGLKDVAVVGLKNMIGIPASKPVPAPSNVTQIATVVPLNPVVTDEELHPELDLTTQTKLF